MTAQITGTPCISTHISRQIAEHEKMDKGIAWRHSCQHSRQWKSRTTTRQSSTSFLCQTTSPNALGLHPKHDQRNWSGPWRNYWCFERITLTPTVEPLYGTNNFLNAIPYLALLMLSEAWRPPQTSYLLLIFILYTISVRLTYQILTKYPSSTTWKRRPSWHEQHQRHSYLFPSSKTWKRRFYRQEQYHRHSCLFFCRH